MVQKYSSDTLQNKKSIISISFFPLQEKPALLVPWMVYTIIFLIVNTIIFIVEAVELFRANVASSGAVNIVAAILLACK